MSKHVYTFGTQIIHAFSHRFQLKISNFQTLRFQFQFTILKYFVVFLYSKTKHTRCAAIALLYRALSRTHAHTRTHARVEHTPTHSLTLPQQIFTHYLALDFVAVIFLSFTFMCSGRVGGVYGGRVRNWSPKMHTHTHSLTTTIDAFVLFAIAISALVSLSLLLLVVEQNKRFLSYYGIVSNMLSMFVGICVCIYVVCVLVYRIYFFLCYFPRFCFVISFTFSRRSYWEGIILSVSRCATLLIHKSCRPSRRRRRRRHLFETANNFSSNRSHVWVAWLTIADWQPNRWNDHLFAANMFDASESNLAHQSCCLLNSKRA